ncbi:MAG: site-specific integrase [Lachnospiraceae bacterium]|nr:site-specific integrase [Lachnospiraceae bacterium]
MGRRGENIRKRADGRWEARVVCGTPVEGRTHYKFLYGRTYQEAKNRKKEYYLAMENGMLNEGVSAANRTVTGMTTADQTAGGSAIPASAQPTAGQQTAARQPPSESSRGPAQQPPQPVYFQEAIQGWLQYKKGNVKESSFAYYTLMVRNHLLPDLGEKPIQEITLPLLTDYYKAKKTSGRVKDGRPMKDKTVADLKAITRQILTWASLNGLLEGVPVCPVVSVRRTPTGVLTREEQNRLEAQLLQEDNPFSLGIWLTLYGGPRVGEVCALKWEDIDFQNGIVQIKKTVNRIADVESGAPAGTKLIVSSPKTECSIRSIPLPEPILQYLKDRRKPGPRYILTGTLHFMEPRACLSRLGRLLERAGVAPHTWHSLRHTFATRCIESGVDVKSLSEIMGHSDVKITMQRYVHPSMDTKKSQVNKLSCSLKPKDTKEQKIQ